MPYFPDIDYASLKRIAVVRRNRLGDMMMVVPALKWLRQMAPQANITLIAGPENIVLTKYFQEDFDQVKLFSGKLGRNWEYVKLLFSPRKYDLVVMAKSSGSRSMNYFLGCTKAKYRLGYTGEHWSRKLVNCRIDEQAAGIPERQAARTLYLLSNGKMGQVPQTLYPRLVVPEAVQQSQYYQVLASQLKTIDTPKLMVSVSNRRPATTLQPEKVARILHACYRVKPFTTVISGVPADQDRVLGLQRCLGNLPHKVLLTHHFDDYMSLIHFMDAALLADSGAVHLTAGFHIPMVALFADMKELWCPLTDTAVILRGDGNVNNIADDTVVTAMHHCLTMN